MSDDDAIRDLKESLARLEDEYQKAYQDLEKNNEQWPPELRIDPLVMKDGTGNYILLGSLMTMVNAKIALLQAQQRQCCHHSIIPS